MVESWGSYLAGPWVVVTGLSSVENWASNLVEPLETPTALRTVEWMDEWTVDNWGFLTADCLGERRADLMAQSKAAQTEPKMVVQLATQMVAPKVSSMVESWAPQSVGKLAGNSENPTVDSMATHLAAVWDQHLVAKTGRRKAGKTALTRDVQRVACWDDWMADYWATSWAVVTARHLVVNWDLTLVEWKV